MNIFSKPEFAWLFAAIIIFAIEALTVNLTTLWFGFGAIIAMVVASLGGSITLQIILFIGSTIIFLLFVRPFAAKYMKKNLVNTKFLIGEQAIVVEKIDNYKDTGKVKLNGTFWIARAESGFVIEEREVVEVVGVSGNRLIVKIKGM